MQFFKNLVFHDNQIRFENRNGVVWGSLTDMSKASNKLTADWLRLDNTKQYLEALESIMGFPIMAVVKGGQVEFSGSWGIQEVILKFAGWCEPTFEIWMHQQIKILLTTGKVELENFERLQEENNQLKSYIDDELGNVKKAAKLNVRADYECFTDTKADEPIIYVKHVLEEKDKAVLKAESMDRDYRKKLEVWKGEYFKALPANASREHEIRRIIYASANSGLKNKLLAFLNSLA